MLNILLITVDSLRADVVNCCNEDKKPSLTPNIDCFAQSSLIFKEAWAQGPYTTASVPSILTGKYAGNLKPIPSNEIAGVLIEGTTTLAEYLKQYGYHTAGFHSNPLLSRIFGYDRGFDFFYDDLFLQRLRLPNRLKLMINRIQRILRPQPYLTAAGINRKVYPWLDKLRQPFFLWVHYMDPHGPYQTKNGLSYLAKFKAERLWQKAVKYPQTLSVREKETLHKNYLQEVSYLDRHFGHLAGKLASNNLLENTLTIITADHGDGFGEHGFYTHPHLLYEELIHVPLIIRPPGGYNEPKIINHPVTLVNLLPTILDYAGLPEADSIDGQSMKPLLMNPACLSLPDYVISEAEFQGENVSSIRSGQWKLIVNNRENTRELFNLAEDPGEQQNLFSLHYQTANMLENQLQMLLRGKDNNPGDISPDLEENEELRERLRGLGYL